MEKLSIFIWKSLCKGFAIVRYQFYLNLKINKAKEWLDYGTYSVKEISYRLSFKDPCYFSRLFTKKTGISPSRWNIQVEKKG